MSHTGWVSALAVTDSMFLAWAIVLGMVIVAQFCIVCRLLYKYGSHPVQVMLDARKKQMDEALANAEKIKSALERTEAQRLQVLHAADVQANRLIEDAQAAAARTREKETRDALCAAEQILTKAREAALRDHSRMLEELKQETRHLVVQTTATILATSIGSEDQQRTRLQAVQSMLSKDWLK